jgi:LCP family protein required for cell wall assembly
MSEQRRSAARRPAGIARHGRLSTPSPVLSVLKFLGIAVVVVAVSAASVLTIDTLNKVAHVKTFDLPGEGDGPPPSIDALPGGFDILVVGTDTGAGQGDLGEGRGAGSGLNDVNILLHVSADHSNAVAVSFPRDLVVPIPSCTSEKTGKTSRAMAAQPINVALSYGGVPCVAATIQNLTGVTIDYAGLITFNGVIEMSNAVGGVPVCFSEDIHDNFTGFTMPAGIQTLQGYSALSFLRSRHGVGDGSDLTRISSQQVFMSSLVRTLKSSDTLGDPLKVYGIANAALTNMELSSGMRNPDTLVSIAKALKDIDLDSVVFTQYPGSTGQPAGTPYAGKVKPNTAIGNKLFAKILADEPFALPREGDGVGSILDPNATPVAPDPSASPSDPKPELEVIAGLRGQTAQSQTCTRKQ